MKRMAMTELEIDYVLEHQRNPSSQYRELWGSVIYLAITDACDFKHRGLQAAALAWLFGDSKSQELDRGIVFTLMGLDVVACQEKLARRIIRRARSEGHFRFLESHWAKELRRIARKR